MRRTREFPDEREDYEDDNFQDDFYPSLSLNFDGTTALPFNQTSQDPHNIHTISCITLRFLDIVVGPALFPRYVRVPTPSTTTEGPRGTTNNLRVITSRST